MLSDWPQFNCIYSDMKECIKYKSDCILIKKGSVCDDREKINEISTEDAILSLGLDWTEAGEDFMPRIGMVVMYRDVWGGDSIYYAVIGDAFINGLGDALYESQPGEGEPCIKVWEYAWLNEGLKGLKTGWIPFEDRG